MILLLIVGSGIGYGLGSTATASVANTTTKVSISTATATTTATSTVTQTVSTSNSSSPYVLTLVLTTNNHFNSTVGDQPAFYVLGPNGLESSASISLPAHRLIKLVIVNYDEGAANLTNPQYSKVSGTVKNEIYFANNTLVNSTMSSSGIAIKGAQTVSSLSTDVIAHTFTIPSLGINIPIPTLSTVVAYFTIDQSGTFTWFCMTVCGSGSDGLGGAMSVPGWMTGSVVVG